MPFSGIIQSNIISPGTMRHGRSQRWSLCLPTKCYSLWGCHHEPYALFNPLRPSRQFKMGYSWWIRQDRCGRRLWPWNRRYKGLFILTYPHLFWPRFYEISVSGIPGYLQCHNEWNGWIGKIIRQIQGQCKGLVHACSIFGFLCGQITKFLYVDPPSPDPDISVLCLRIPSILWAD